MPVALPTPEEFAALNWRNRDKAVKTARSLLRTYGGVYADEVFEAAADLAERLDARWAESVREEARRLEREAKRRKRGKR